MYCLNLDGRGARPRLNLDRDGAILRRSPSPAVVARVMRGDAERIVAEHARGDLFVHAGVVESGGRAIVVPGRSHTGKTRLVAALLRAGARYYSDEFAVIDRAGRVRPFGNPLSIRRRRGKPGEEIDARRMGASIGKKSVPVALVAAVRYRRGSALRLRPMTPGRTLLALLANTVPARARAADALRRFRSIVAIASGVEGIRGEAAGAAAELLARIDAARRR